MIEVSDRVRPGDLVYAWFLPPKTNKNQKKQQGVEYRFGDAPPNHIKLESPDGGYSLTFSRELIETWSGEVRPVK